jgi:hypothetical protein
VENKYTGAIRRALNAVVRDGRVLRNGAADLDLQEGTMFVGPGSTV